MTFQALNTAITGLRAAQQQLSVISNNVTNATTPGYSRQVLPQKTQILRESGTTIGVLTEQVVRQVDMNLQRNLWTQVSATSLQGIQLDYLQQIQNFNGPPDKGFSIATKLAELRDSFSALSDLPDDIQVQESVVNQANIVAGKFNDYAEMLKTLRNDAQGDLETSVKTVNSLLKELETINTQIRSSDYIGNSVAALQDQRDIAIKALSDELEISYFTRGDGVTVVQTKEGYELVGDVAHKLEFQSSPISAKQYYPDSASGVILIQETDNGVQTRTDLTERVIGGKIGGLIELRDEKLPAYQAQIDELAFQTAHRLNLQGLKLFTDQNGYIPENTPPDITTDPPTPVAYVDFARTMKVNKKIIDDPSLLQSGTYNPDVVIPSGDNSVIRRVIEFGFGDVHYQEAIGEVDLFNIGAATDLQEWLGLSSGNRVVMGLDFSSFQNIDDGVAGTNDLLDSFQDFFLDWPDGDQFRLTFEEARAGSSAFGPTQVTIDLSDANAAYPIGSLTYPVNGTNTNNNALDQLLSYINFQIDAAGLTDAQASASTNNYGQLIFSSTGDITVDRDYDPILFPEAMPIESLEALGMRTGTFVTEDPNFMIRVGNNAPVTITIEPGDTITELVDKLTWDSATETGVPGLYVEIDALTGGLILRPGIDNDNWVPPSPTTTEPFYGGDITITSGPYSTTLGVNGNPALIDGINVVSALFGNYTGSGATLVEGSPVTDVRYESETLDASGEYTNFRNKYLGPDASISTGIFSSLNLLDYVQKVVDETAQDYLKIQSAHENEDTLRGILQRQFSDQAGVNIDEEMSYLIVVQTAYAAAARTITAADEMFQELINSIRR